MPRTLQRNLPEFFRENRPSMPEIYGNQVHLCRTVSCADDTSISCERFAPAAPPVVVVSDSGPVFT